MAMGFQVPAPPSLLLGPDSAAGPEKIAPRFPYPEPLIKPKCAPFCHNCRKWFAGRCSFVQDSGSSQNVLLLIPE